MVCEICNNNKTQEPKGKTTQQNWVGQEEEPLVPQLETPMQVPGQPERNAAWAGTGLCKSGYSVLPQTSAVNTQKVNKPGRGKKKKKKVISMFKLPSVLISPKEFPVTKGIVVGTPSLHNWLLSTSRLFSYPSQTYPKFSTRSEVRKLTY